MNRSFFFCRLVLILVCILGLAAANTETVHFQMEPGIVRAGPDIPRGGSLWLDKERKKNKINVKVHNPPKVGDSVTQWFRIEEPLDGTKYEARVCWPASSPADFRLMHINDVVGVVITPRFYSYDADLMQNPPDIEYQLVLNKLVFGVLAEDLVSTILLSTVGGLAAVTVIYWLMK